MPAQWGFSLIEMLAVIVIIAVLSGAALLSVDLGGPQARLNDEANRLSSLLRLLCEESVLRGQEQGLVLLEDGYAFAQWTGEQWIHHPQRVFRIRNFEPGFSARLSGLEQARLAEDDDASPHVICFSSGEMTPFELDLVGPEGRTLTVTGDALGELELHDAVEG